MFGVRAPLWAILQIFPSTHTSLLWTGCLNQRGRSPLSLSIISLCKLGFYVLKFVLIILNGNGFQIFFIFSNLIDI